MTYTFTRPEYRQLERTVQAQRWEIFDTAIQSGNYAWGAERMARRYGTSFSEGDFRVLCDRYTSTRTVAGG